MLYQLFFIQQDVDESSDEDQELSQTVPKEPEDPEEEADPTPQIPPPVITEYDVDQMLKEEREKVEAKQKRKEEKRAKKEAKKEKKLKKQEKKTEDLKKAEEASKKAEEDERRRAEEDERRKAEEETRKKREHDSDDDSDSSSDSDTSSESTSSDDDDDPHPPPSGGPATGSTPTKKRAKKKEPHQKKSPKKKVKKSTPPKKGAKGHALRDKDRSAVTSSTTSSGSCSTYGMFSSESSDSPLIDLPPRSPSSSEVIHPHGSTKRGTSTPLPSPDADQLPEEGQKMESNSNHVIDEHQDISCTTSVIGITNTPEINPPSSSCSGDHPLINLASSSSSSGEVPTVHNVASSSGSNRSCLYIDTRSVSETHIQSSSDEHHEEKVLLQQHMEPGDSGMHPKVS